MSRKDFILIAKVLKEAKKYMNLEDWLYISSKFQLILADTNPRFDAKKFRQAVGLDNVYHL